jgi:molybdate transport system substrate-binding protein
MQWAKHSGAAAGLLIFTLIVGCNPADPRPNISVAAAANLSEAFNDIGREFERQSGVRVIYSYASTAQLSQQIENSAPFDVFAAADTAHVDHLIRDAKLIPESRTVYARGKLALWIPRAKTPAPTNLEFLTTPEIRFISIANPNLAPYGQAAVEALKASGLWENVQAKIVYANNISMARQHAASGNADAALTALSLVFKDKGMVLEIEERLYSPLDQALGIVASSTKREAADRFRTFLLGPSGRNVLARYRYTFPAVQ